MYVNIAVLLICLSCLQLMNRLASILANDERANPALVQRLVPTEINAYYLENMLRVYNCVYLDFVLSCHISMLSGALKMSWQFDQEQHDLHINRLLRDPERLLLLVETALDKIDYDAVDQFTVKVVRECGTGIIPGEKNLFAQGAAAAAAAAR